MEFTNEQITEILSNEETRGTFLESIASNEHGKSYLDNFANIHFDTNVGSKIGEIHGGYDKDLEEATGIKKPDGVKSYTFWKEEVLKLKQKADLSNPEILNQLKAQNNELKSKIESGESSKHFKDLYESTKNTAQNEIEKYKGELETYKNNETKNKINSDLKNTVEKFGFDDTIKKSVLDTFINNKLKQLTEKAKVSEDGSISYYDENDSLILNKKTMLKANAEYILAEKLKDVIAEKRIVEGGGGDGEKEGKKSIGDFSNAKNQQQLNTLIGENLLVDGYIKGTQEYQEKYTELLKANKGNLPLR